MSEDGAAIAADGNDTTGDTTFPRLLAGHARVRPGRTAIREKDLGIWLAWSWSQVADEVRAIAGGLATLGFERGRTVAIIGDNRPRLYWTMAAVQALGGVAVPLYQDAIADEVLYEVLLPAPLGPMNPNISPASIFSETDCTAVKSP